MTNSFTTKAEIRLHHGQFQIIKSGDYVECSITKEKISLDNLKYWNVDFQEIYANPEVALRRYCLLYTSDAADE